MNCMQHPDRPAAAFCRSCGKPLCAECKRQGYGIIYCEEHLPAGATEGPPPAPAPAQGQEVASPPLAFFLGFAVPGVGAIYNGQYAKGLVHALIFGAMVTALSNMHEGEPLLAMLLAAFVFYQAFEAYHTAKKRNLGQPVDEFSSLLNMRQSSSAGAISLIVLGVVFLLNTLEIVSFHEISRFWPVLLIALGAYMLYGRLQSNNGNGGSTQEAHHERQ